MSEIRIRFDTDNQGLRTEQGTLESNEVMKILRSIGEAIHYEEFLPNKFNNVHDVNGNVIGTWKITEDSI